MDKSTGCTEITSAYGSFGEWLRAWRTWRGLSLSGAADRAGMRPSTWHNLEVERHYRKGGEPPMPNKTTVQALAAALELPLAFALCAAGYAPHELHQLALTTVPPGPAAAILEIPDFAAAMEDWHAKLAALRSAGHALGVAIGNSTFAPGYAA